MEPLVLPDGRIIEKASGSGTNEGTAAADVSVEVAFSYISEIEDVKSIILKSASPYAIDYSVSGNKVTVTVKGVAAGETVTVEVEAIGYQ